MSRFLLAALVCASLGACTWVKPSVKSHTVVLKDQNSVVNCVKKGLTKSKTLSKIVFIPRSDAKMFSELVMLAKNEAVLLEGDTVVPEGDLVGGEQSFGVYRCN